MPQCRKSTTKKQLNKKPRHFFNKKALFSAFFVLNSYDYRSFLFQKGIIIVFFACVKRLNSSNV